MKTFQFDHITYVAERTEKESILKRIGNNNDFDWCELDREILPGKKDFFSYCQSAHDLYFFGHGEIPIEFIFYNQCNVPSVSVNVSANTIYCKSVSIEAARKCAQYIGAKILEENAEYVLCNIKGILDRKTVFLKLFLDDAFTDKPHLDDTGYGCVALVVNSIFPEKMQKGKYLSQMKCWCMGEVSK